MNQIPEQTSLDTEWLAGTNITLLQHVSCEVLYFFKNHSDILHSNCDFTKSNIRITNLLSDKPKMYATLSQLSKFALHDICRICMHHFFLIPKLEHHF